MNTDVETTTRTRTRPTILPRDPRRRMAAVAAGVLALGVGAALAMPLVGGPGIDLGNGSQEMAALGKVSEAPLPPAPARQLTGVPTYNVVTVKNRLSDGTDLPASHSEENWYYCGGYERISTPSGVDSAYPYYQGDTSNWHNRSSGSITASGLVITNPNGVKILFTNWGFHQGESRIDFTCGSLNPVADGVKSIGSTVTKVAVGSAEVQTVTSTYNSAVKSWHIEYGFTPDNYTQRTADADPSSRNTWAHQSSTQTQTITGLQPGTRYHYRIVTTDIKGVVSFGPPENTFTTPENPRDGTIYGIVSADDASLYMDDPSDSSASNTQLSMATGTGQPAQQWRLEQGDGNGYFHLVNAVNGQCADIHGGDVANNPIDLWPCDVNGTNQSNQMWKAEPDEIPGTYRLVSKAGLYLSTPTQFPTKGQELVAKTGAVSLLRFVPLS